MTLTEIWGASGSHLRSLQWMVEPASWEAAIEGSWASLALVGGISGVVDCVRLAAMSKGIRKSN